MDDLQRFTLDGIVLVEGSVALFSGVDEQGRNVRLGVDARFADAIAFEILTEGVCEVAAEGWQVLA